MSSPISNGSGASGMDNVSDANLQALAFAPDLATEVSDMENTQKVTEMENTEEVSNAENTQQDVTVVSSLSQAATNEPQQVDNNQVAAQQAPQMNIIVHPNVVVPFVGTNGNFYTMDTPVDAFEDWVDYMSFCSSSRQFRVQFANAFDSLGNVVDYHGMQVSVKLMNDFSDYFKAMVRGPWVEAKQGFVGFDDILMQDFKRLYFVIQAGAPAARINIGRFQETMRNYCAVYTLADRFQMPTIKTWIQASIEDYMRENRAWTSLYTSQVLSLPPVPGAAADHTDRVMDFNTAYVMCAELPEKMRPVPLPTLVQFLVNYCPRPLLKNVINNFDQELMHDICHALL